VSSWNVRVTELHEKGPSFVIRQREEKREEGDEGKKAARVKPRASGGNQRSGSLRKNDSGERERTEETGKGKLRGGGLWDN